MIDVAAHKHRRIPPPLWRDCLKKNMGSGSLDLSPLLGGDEDHQLYRGAESDPENTLPPEAVAGPGYPRFATVAGE